jgi:hypothetical protein
MECSVDRLLVTEVAVGTVRDALSCCLLRLVSPYYIEKWNGYEGKITNSADFMYFSDSIGSSRNVGG